MKFIIGKKTGMARVFDEDGRSFAVTKISALPCKISQIKNSEKDKYKAFQVTAYATSNEVGAGVPASAKRNAGQKKVKVVKIAEFHEENIKKFKVGEKISAKQFNKNEMVTVEGTGKGKGFAGTIKRHKFHMGPVSHGSKNVRKPGSIGGGYPERVVKGRKMAGRMGGKNVSVKNLRVVDIEDEILLIAGAIPGPNGGIVKVYGEGEKAEEVIDRAAEEEKLAQEKMLEADAERKESEASEEKSAAQPEMEIKEEKKEEVKTEN